MKKKYFILLGICIVLIGNSVKAADFYPEMGMDPFFSHLNPEYIDEEMGHEHDTVINFFKKKKQDFEDRKNGVKPAATVNSANKNAVNKTEKKPILFWSNKPKSKNEIPAVNNDNELKNPVETTEEIIEEKQEETVESQQETVENPEEFVFGTRPGAKTSKTKKELEKEILEEERENKKAEDKANYVPLKQRLNIFKKKAPKEPEVNVEPNIELTADYMEYFPERFEVEAIGNAKILFKEQKTTLTAHKIVFNYDRNVLKAHENVVLISETTITEGDFVKLDLNKPNGWVENPVSRTEDIELRAKEAFLYSNKIEEYDGVAKILKDDVISFGARSFASYINQSNVFATDEPKLSDADKGVYKIKANKIIIDSQKDHEVITVKNADLYLKNHRIAAIPSVKIVTNKQHASAETNLPEFGSQAMLGMHLGPAVVLNVPGGSTLKLAPIVTYKDDKFGIGGIARFRNVHNMTEMAYGTSKDEFLLRGKQKFAPGWSLEYSRYTNQSEWFLGYRMPKYGAQLSYSRTDFVNDLGLQFSQRYTAGAFVDRYGNKTDLSDAEGRFRWMTQTDKPFFEYMNEEQTVGLRAGVVAQTAATVYTTGDTVGLVRFGPALRTKVGPWNQALMFYETASAGQSPFEFDRYRYGRSNFLFIENLKVCKYLSVGYLASLSINSDYKDDKLFQESRLLVGIGPEYAKLVVGYDARRRNTMLFLTMLVGTKDSELEFKKSEINNPERFGKERKKQKKEKRKSYKKFLKDKDLMYEPEVAKK